MPPGLAVVRRSPSSAALPSTSWSIAVTDQSVTEGDTVTVSGQLSSDAYGAVVLLQRRTTGSLTWTTVDSATASSEGRVAFTRRPSAGTYYYRLASVVGATSARAASRSVRVKVRSACPALASAAMSIVVSAPCLRAGESVTIVGRMRDGCAGVVGAVVTLERRTSGSSPWHTVATHMTDVHGEVAFTHEPSAGTSDYRVVHDAGPAYAYAASNPVRVVVSS